MSDSKNKPCPYCGSQRQTANIWIINDKEVDAIECTDCFSGALKYVWNNYRWDGKSTPKPVIEMQKLLFKSNGEAA